MTFGKIYIYIYIWNKWRACFIAKEKTPPGRRFGKINSVENKRGPESAGNSFFWVKSQKKPVHSDRPRGGEPRAITASRVKKASTKKRGPESAKLSQSRRQRGFSPWIQLQRNAVPETNCKGTQSLKPIAKELVRTCSNYCKTAPNYCKTAWLSYNPPPNSKQAHETVHSKYDSKLNSDLNLNSKPESCCCKLRLSLAGFHTRSTIERRIISPRRSHLQ